MGRYDDVNNAQKKDDPRETDWIEQQKEQQNTDPKRPEDDSPRK